MNDHRLTDLLERAVEQTYVGPAPLDRIRTGARRRRRTSALVATAAAVAVIATGATVLRADRGASPGPSTLTTQSTDPSQVPRHGNGVAGTDLHGTWTVAALAGRSGRSVLPEESRGAMTLTFTGGRLHGDTGCNAISGTYLQGGPGGKDVRFPRRQLSTTLVGCSDEPPLLSRLSHVRHVSGSAGVRFLHSADGMVIAELRRG